MENQILFGDIHNHNAIGFGQGSFEHSLKVAKNNFLDFWAFTPHAQFADLPEGLPRELIEKYNKGFAEVERKWPLIQRKVREANQPGKFTVFLGYERHSCYEGDYVIIYPEDDMPLVYTDTLLEFQEHARKYGAILVPHHIFYAPGCCGINWELYDEEVSPVIEIYSEHGGAEYDWGPFLGLRHSAGGRYTAHTMQAGLGEGRRFGVVASSDDHWGSPGTYDEGIMAVIAEANTRKSILQAIRERRTYALTGDRIKLEFYLNDAPMGSILTGKPEKRQIKVRVKAWNVIDRIEILKNNVVVYRAHPIDNKPELFDSTGQTKRFRIYIQYGWGQYKEWIDTGTYDWDIKIGVIGGEITEFTPCFRHGPFCEDKIDSLVKESSNSVRVQSFTSRDHVLNDDATKGVKLEVVAPDSALLKFESQLPAICAFEKTFRDLSVCNHIEFIGDVPAPSVLVHRPVSELLYAADFEWYDTSVSNRDVDYYYVRVIQSDGQTAWSSPIWVEN